MFFFRGPFVSSQKLVPFWEQLQLLRFKNYCFNSARFYNGMNSFRKAAWRIRWSLSERDNVLQGLLQRLPHTILEAAAILRILSEFGKLWPCAIGTQLQNDARWPLQKAHVLYQLGTILVSDVRRGKWSEAWCGGWGPRIWNPVRQEDVQGMAQTSWEAWHRTHLSWGGVKPVQPRGTLCSTLRSQTESQDCNH